MDATHAAWDCWTIFSLNVMAIRGYSSYRGKNKGKLALIIGLVVILLVAVGLLIMQNYRVYDDTGKAHWEFPFSQKEDPKDEKTNIDPDDVNIQREEPAFAVGKDLKPMQAQELPLWYLSDDYTELLTNAPEGVVMNVKTNDGSIAYHSKVTTPEEVAKGGESTLAWLKAVTSSDHTAVARMACLCDNAYAYAKTEQAALCNEDGSLWWDYYGRYWLDPTKKDTQTYVTELCKEYVTLGFDEIMLDYFGYPADWQGDADRTAALTKFVTDLREALPEGTRISIFLRELPSAENGLTAGLLNTAFDRIYTDGEMDTEALLKVLPKEFDATTRLVKTVWETPENGSYMLAANE